MIQRLVWSKQAERSYGQIIDYVADEFGASRARQYIAKVNKEVNKLIAHPELGQIEPWLEGSRFEFRQLVIEHLTKIIYRVTDDSIEIADVWDVRQDPEALAARITQ